MQQDTSRPIHYYTDTSSRNASHAEKDAPLTLTTPEGFELPQITNHYLTNRAVYLNGRFQVTDQYISVSVVDYDNAALVTRCNDMEAALALIDSRRKDTNR